MNGLHTAPSELDGDLAAWRNLLWDSVRMLHAGRPDLASRFRAAAAEIERTVRTTRQLRRPGLAAG